MPAKSNEALVKPEILLWVRESAGLELEDAARKAGIKPERLQACELGHARLTIAQLRNLSDVYKRPLALFFMPAPLAPETSLHDYRKLPGKSEADTSPALRLEIRKAKYRREIAVDLFREIGSEPPIFSAKAMLDDDVNKVAAKVRSLLGVKVDEQSKLQDKYRALNYWRDKIEAQGILIFQASVPLNEMRGFSIWDSPLPIIVVNTKDTPLGRIFTMLHELTHLMLRSTGLCLLNDRDRTEVFCNAVAGAALVPERDLLNQDTVILYSGKLAWDETSIRGLAGHYSVSREVILRRLLDLNRIAGKFYRMKMAQYESEYDRKEREEIMRADSGGAPQHVKTISNAGKTFVRLVVDSYHQDKINLSDVSQYLGIKLKHLSSIEQAITNPSNYVGEFP